MQRRDFLAGCAFASLSTAATGRLAGHTLQEKMEIIDCHTHFYDPSRPEGVPWPRQNTGLYRTVLPQHLRELTTYLPVTGTVVVEASPWLEDNQWLLELAANEPMIVGVVGNLQPGQPEFAQHLKRFAANPLFRGFRIQKQTLQKLLTDNQLSDLKRMIDLDLTLDVNGDPETPAVIAELSARLPKLKIVLNHLGNIRITRDKPPLEWSKAIQAAAKNPNVFAKISSLMEGASRDGLQAPEEMDFYKPYLDIVWNAFGDKRVIYGSNWPVSERAGSYQAVQKLAFEYAATHGEQAVRHFAALNAKRAYQWVDRPGRP